MHISYLSSALTRQEKVISRLMGLTTCPRLLVKDLKGKGRGLVSLEEETKGSYVLEYEKRQKITQGVHHRRRGLLYP